MTVGKNLRLESEITNRYWAKAPQHNCYINPNHHSFGTHTYARQLGQVFSSFMEIQTEITAKQ